VVLGGRYRLERRLAQGGMAEVWLAVDMALDRRVAVKWLKPSLATDPIVAERFRREAVAVASLTHPNIVAVHDVFEENGRQAVVMQLVDGKSLRQLLDVQTRLSPELTIHIGMCVASALDAAHQAGFVHRDVKPGNILITPDGRVLLTDFGIAKGVDGDDDLTSDNVMMGTAKYLSPEQVRGRKLDGRADLYSLGLVLYECLAGRVPFVGTTDADTALARLQRDPTDLGRLRPMLSKGLVELIHRLLSRNPNRRPASGADLRAELQRVASEPTVVLDDTAAVDTSPGDPGRRSRGRTTGTQPAVGRGGRRRYDRVSADGRASAARAVGVSPTAVQPHPYERLADTRDHTPPAGPALRGRPARDMQTSFAPSVVLICLLLAVGFVVALVLFATIRKDDPNGAANGTGGTDAPVTTPAPTDGGAVIGALTPGNDQPTTAAATITAARAFSLTGGPPPNADLASAAIDGLADTAWSGVCHRDEYTTAHGGLVVDLSKPAGGTLAITVGNAPYQIWVYATSDPTAPTDLDGWGEPVAKVSGAAAGQQSATIPDGTAHAMLRWVEVGPDASCGPGLYRGVLSEVAFTAAG